MVDATSRTANVTAIIVLERENSQINGTWSLSCRNRHGNVTNDKRIHARAPPSYARQSADLLLGFGILTRRKGALTMGRKLARFLYSTMTPFCFLAVLGGTAMAQRGAMEIHNAPNYAAAAIAIVPDYVGSDDATVAAAPAGRFTFGKNQEIKLVGTTLSSNLLGHEFLRLGPTVNYRFGRKSVDDELVDLMNDIDGTFEVGATAGLDFRNDTNPRFRFGIFLEFLQDVGDGHEGALVTGTLQYWKPVNRAWDFGFRTGLTYGSGDYMNTYFGVSAADSARSGLPQFSAGDGLRDVTVTPSLVLHLSEKWHVGGFVRYQRILSDAADSPVVDQRGSPNQFWIGLGTAYSW